jgi:integrase/recombinase XerD
MKNPESLVRGYLRYQKGYGLTDKTRERNKYLVRRFLRWIDGTDIREVKKKHIAKYREHLKEVKSRYTKKNLQPGSIQLEMSTLKGFFEYLLKHEVILKNPMEGMKIKEPGSHRVRSIFSEEDIEIFLDSIEVKTSWGQRDRACFELIYSSGLRVGDVLTLECESVNLEERILLIKQGKGKKDRYVPFSEAALRFLMKYLQDGRRNHKRLIRDTEKRQYMFLGRKGYVSYEQLKKAFQKYLKACGLEKKGYTIHSIRHATGTHLLSHGASIRYVQELLGHEDLKTTQLYTRPTFENIKSVYRTYHPRENEYYEEVDEEYVKQVKKLKLRLEWEAKRGKFRKIHGHTRGFGRWKEKKNE